MISACVPAIKPLPFHSPNSHLPTFPPALGLPSSPDSSLHIIILPMAYATAVSSEVSQYILSRARELYLQRQRGDYLRKRSLELSKQYPLECTRALMQMSHCHHPGLRPETLPIKEEPEMRPAKCSGDLHQAIRVKSVTPRSTLRSSAERPSSGGTNKRIGEVAEKDSQRAARLVAL